ncbi:DNA/RNA helicase domain-containing protein [Promicromonospora sp. NPDC050262]|uniref:DNA/RNA helicase domain-containing protein n=1 Tax=Promicromonospora sp. NPDC050262 TaxID=3155036 RepID=UPI0033EA2967
MFGIAQPTERQLTTFIRNIYAVLLTRGIRGTYVYVCDPVLRERLRPYFSGVVDS